MVPKHEEKGISIHPSASRGCRVVSKKEVAINPINLLARSLFLKVRIEHPSLGSHSLKAAFSWIDYI